MRMTNMVSVAVAVIGVMLVNRPALAQNPHPGSAPVNIVGPLPLPVTGTISVAPGGAITVSNPEGNPVLTRDVDRLLPSQQVTVMTFFGDHPCNGGFTGARAIDTRIMPDGAPIPFVIPAGQVFVVTSIGVSVDGQGNTSDTVRVGTGCGAGCMVPFTDVQVSIGPNGQGGKDLVIPHGFVVRPPTQICVADVNHSSPNALATLRGYLAKDQ